MPAKLKGRFSLAEILQENKGTKNRLGLKHSRVHVHVVLSRPDL